MSLTNAQNTVWETLNPINDTARNGGKPLLKGIIFDLDSTLIQAKIDFVEMKKHMIKVLEDNGHPKDTLSPTDQTTVKIMECAKDAWDENGKTSEECAEIEAAIEEIMNKGELDAIVNLVEIDGTSEAIQKLKERGLRLAILTRSHHAYAIQALEKISLIKKFDVILGRGETPEPKPYKGAIDHTLKLLNLGPDDVAMIGDHQIDRDSAINSGTMFIGVNTGRRGLRSWTDEKPPEHFLESVKLLPDYLDSLGLLQ